MTVLVVCDGARAESVDEVAERVVCIVSDAKAPTTNLRIEPLQSAIRADVPPLAADLVRIAVYVYFADQMVPREAETDVSGDRWQRRLHVVAPLSKPDVWSEPEVSRALAAVVGYATGDVWMFSFGAGTPAEVQLRMPGWPPPSASRDADCVASFSGGLDSLIAAIELTDSGRRPFLGASYDRTSVLIGKRAELIGALRDVCPSWTFPTLGIHVNKVGVDEKERTQRARAFLYELMCGHDRDRQRE